MRTSPRPDQHRVWQVGGGPTNRSYSDLLVKHGVALIGPGSPGPWSKGCDESDFEGSYVRRFAEETHVGDIVLLRSGTVAVVAVGVIAGEYEFLTQFDDVNGWDLSHARRVRWFLFEEQYKFGSKVFGANPTRFSSVNNAEAADLARRWVNSDPRQWQSDRLPDLPPDEPAMKNVPAEIAAIANRAQELSAFFRSPDNGREDPAEDELVGHLVLPLLRALGWQDRHIAVKWHNIDVCLFSRAPREPSNCAVIIEAKRIGAGVEGAFQQAKDYVDKLGVLRDIVVTDGFRYRLYAADKAFGAHSYANLLRLKESASNLFDRLRRC